MHRRNSLSIGANDIFADLSAFGSGKITLTQADAEVGQAAAQAAAATYELFAFGPEPHMVRRAGPRRDA